MTEKTIRTYCTLCGVGCPSAITVDGDRVLKLEPDREHPDGGAVCAKGRAAPEIHDHAHRINYPMRRTRPKTDPDPGWERCTWDEALDLIATKLGRVRDESGPQAVAFGRGTGGGTGLSPAEPWALRLANVFGSPNYMTNSHLCNWPRDGASHYTFGVYPLPMPEVERSACIVLWGHNPPATLLSLATDVVAARARGAKLVVVDPRRVGLANKADYLLQVRPGTDGALALAFVHELIERHWYDETFVREWTNAPFLVRGDSGRLLRAGDVRGPVFAAADQGAPVVLENGIATPVASSASVATAVALHGAAEVELREGGRVTCRTVFDLLADEARACAPDLAADITGVPEAQIRGALRLIVENRPVSHYLWNGVVQHTNGTQACRAIEIFYALIGDYDREGGNVRQLSNRTADIGATRALSSDAAMLRLGREDRPLGPPSAEPGNIAAFDLFSAILEAKPYPVRALLSFGGNILLNTGDTLRGLEALQRLEFFAQADLFFTPSNRYADVILPATSFLENETLVVRSGVAQRRIRSVRPLYDRRADIDVIFDLAVRLGLGADFANGDVAAAFDSILDPAGLSWEGMRAQPHGVRVAPPTRYAKYAEQGRDGQAVGFPTPSRKVELFAEAFVEQGQPGLPRYEEPAWSPRRTPDIAREFPLVLTNAKLPQYLHSQHRGVTAIRRTHPDPTAEMHPETAERYGIRDGEWIVVETPRGRVRAVADVTDAIVPGVVCGNHGWWEAAEELGREGLDPFTERGANLNLLVHNDLRDPISGSVPHRSTLCRVRPVAREPAERQERDAASLTA